MTEEIAKYDTKTEEIANSDGAFQSAANFDLAQRMAKMLASSQLVPQAYRGQIADCVIALEMANRIGASPMAVLQNMYIVHGKPAWSSQFLIACLNASGKFSPIRYKMEGEEGSDSRTCIAWAKDLSDGDVLEGPKVSMAMAKAEGWLSKNGSKWQTMPELMLRYRAATFFARLHAPEITMGILTNEEVIDISPGVTEHPVAADADQTPKDRLRSKLAGQRRESEEQPAEDVATPEDKPLPNAAMIAATLGTTQTGLRKYCGVIGMIPEKGGSLAGLKAEDKRELVDNAEKHKSALADMEDNS